MVISWCSGYDMGLLRHCIPRNDDLFPVIAVKGSTFFMNILTKCDAYVINKNLIKPGLFMREEK